MFSSRVDKVLQFAGANKLTCVCTWYCELTSYTISLYPGSSPHFSAGEEPEYEATIPLYYIHVSITIVQNYTGKYHEFVAVCIVTSAQHE